MNDFIKKATSSRKRPSFLSAECELFSYRKVRREADSIRRTEGSSNCITVGLLASAACGAVVATASVVKAKESIAIAIAAEQKQNQNPAPVVSTSIATPTAVVREQREKNDQKENVILATHNCRLLE